jgi:OOP family OmpA-OmpF porin
MRILGLSVLLASALLATEYSYEISPMIGGVIPEGNANISNQAAIGLRFQVNDWELLGFVPELSYDFSPSEDYDDSGDATINRLAVNALYEFNKEEGSTLIPYLLVGLGYENVSNENHGFLDNQNYNSSMYGNWGGGVKWKIMDDIALRGEVKHLIRTNDGINELYYGIGLAIPFGEKPAPEPAQEEVMEVSKTEVVEVKEIQQVDHDVEEKTIVAATTAVVVVAVDKDHDGVMDDIDQCLNSHPDSKVDEKGCEKTIVLHIKFKYDSADIDYAFDSTKISKGSEAELQGYADFMQRNPEYDVSIVGHTDSRGPKAYNQKLSEQRAAKVKEDLVKRGIDSSRITTVGKGEADPIATNDTDAGRAQNRRIEAVLTRVR